MADYENIFDLTKKFTTHQELKDYAASQYKALEKAAKHIEQLMAEVDHLKGLLDKTVPAIAPKAATPRIQRKPVVKIEVSPEQATCEIEIKRLRDKAFTGELSFEDTKRLDLLVKNLILSKEHAKGGSDISLPDGVTEGDLIELINDESAD